MVAGSQATTQAQAKTTPPAGKKHPGRKPGKRPKPSKPHASRSLLAVTLTQSQDTDSNETVWNPCTSEPVALTGPIHQIFHVTLNDDGSTHVHIDSNYQGVKGVGQFTGKTYSTQDVVMSDVNILGPLPYVQDMHEITHYNFLGNVKFPVPDDFFLHFSFHMTLNATGTPTSTKSTGFEITCK